MTGIKTGAHVLLKLFLGKKMVIMKGGGVFRMVRYKFFGAKNSFSKT